MVGVLLFGVLWVGLLLLGGLLLVFFVLWDRGSAQLEGEEKIIFCSGVVWGVVVRGVMGSGVVGGCFVGDCVIVLSGLFGLGFCCVRPGVVGGIFVGDCVVGGYLGWGSVVWGREARRRLLVEFLVFGGLLPECCCLGCCCSGCCGLRVHCWGVFCFGPCSSKATPGFVLSGSLLRRCCCSGIRCGGEIIWGFLVWGRAVRSRLSAEFCRSGVIVCGFGV